MVTIFGSMVSVIKACAFCITRDTNQRQVSVLTNTQGSKGQIYEIFCKSVDVKVIIEMSRGEVSPVGQGTIENVS